MFSAASELARLYGLLWAGNKTLLFSKTSEGRSELGAPECHSLMGNCCSEEAAVVKHAQRSIFQRPEVEI